MENVKYLLFYALMIVVISLGFMNYDWIVIFPSALVLSIGVIVVKGKEWRQVLGKGNMNPVLVSIAIFVSQIVISALLYGLGLVLSMIFSAIF